MGGAAVVAVERLCSLGLNPVAMPRRSLLFFNELPLSACSSYSAVSLLLPKVLITISTYYIVSEAAVERTVRTKWSPPTVRTWYCSAALIVDEQTADGR